MGVHRFMTGFCALVLSGTFALAVSAQSRGTVVVGLFGDPNNLVPGSPRLFVSGHASATLFFPMSVSLEPSRGVSSCEK